MLGGVLRGEQRSLGLESLAWGVWPGDEYLGSTVNPMSAMQLLAVSGSVRFISDGISTLPIDAYRELPDGTRVETPVPLWVRHPTPELNWQQWCGQMLASVLLQSNAYATVLRTGTGQIAGLQPQDPENVRIERYNGVRRVWLNGRQFTGELLHIPGLMLPGKDVGLSPIEYARQSIGLGLAAQSYGKNYFDAGEGNMPGVIEMPRKAVPEAMRAIADNWRRKRAKGGKGLPGVLDDGATWKATGVTNEQAQFLATRQFTAAEIAGQIFMIDPTELGIGVEGSSITYANIEQRAIRRVQITYLPWITRLENAISELMAAPRYFKINVDGLLRGDSAARWATYKTAAEINEIASRLGQKPVMLTDEMRDFEDLSHLDGPDPEPMPAPAVPVPAAPAA